MKKTKNYLGKIIFWSVFALAISALHISAATFTVTNTNDTGAGSLRQAILDANAAAGDDVIAFDASVFNEPRTITVASLITITGNGGLTINGTGVNLLTISGNNANRIFELSGLSAPAIGAIVFNNLTIADGLSAASGAGMGGGIGINNGQSSAGTYTPVNFTANNVVFRNNRGGVNAGGAIGCFRAGVVNVNNSIFTLGSANGGAAIDGGSGSGTCSINVNNSSIFENTRTAGNDVLVCCGNGSGTVSINNSAFYNNGRAGGGTIIEFSSSGGNKSITNSTIANNISTGGALVISNNSTTTINTLTNVTIAGNYASSASSPGGLDQTVGLNIVQIGNSIIANNYNAVGPSDVEIGSNNIFTSQGYNLLENVNGLIGGSTTGNLIGVDPWLAGTMRDNGGATKTLALRPGSPAIDAGNPTSFPPADQRGITRPQDGDGTGGARSDIGAFERRLIDSVPTDIADFDGDGKTDISIFRPSDGSWWYQLSAGSGFRVHSFGLGSDIITPGDFTGDGKSDIAVFRPATGFWYIQRSEDNTFFSFPFGANGDVPVPGDYDADGKADAAVFRPSAGTWFILNSGGSGTSIVNFGISEDKPVAADFDGDRKTDIAIFRPSDGSWWYLRSSDSQFRVFRFGLGTDKPVQGDYSGDGKADIAVWRPSTGEWFVQRSEDNSYFSIPFGTNGDVPVPGDYDGDGKFDTAVFRPSTATWFMNRTSAGVGILQFGASGDRPVPNAYVP